MERLPVPVFFALTTAFAAVPELEFEIRPVAAMVRSPSPEFTALIACPCPAETVFRSIEMPPSPAFITLTPALSPLVPVPVATTPPATVSDTRPPLPSREMPRLRPLTESAETVSLPEPSFLACMPVLLSPVAVTVPAITVTSPLAPEPIAEIP